MTRQQPLISTSSRTSVMKIDTKMLDGRRKKGSINQRVGFRLRSGWIHHSSHAEVQLWTLVSASDTRVDGGLGMKGRSTDEVGREGCVVVGGGRRGRSGREKSGVS